MKERLNNIQQEQVLNAGLKRAETERALLSFLFNGFSNIVLDKSNYHLVCLMDELFELESYAQMTGELVDHNYTESSLEIQKYSHVLIALNGLHARSLIERKIYFSKDHMPEDGFCDLEGKLDDVDAYSNFWLARGLHIPQSQSFMYPEHLRTPQSHPTTFILEQIEFQLTTKGFDVALKLQEHKDNEARFNRQKELTEAAVKASQSSAKTARIALWAASFIAIGSIGNLFFSIYKYCVQL